MRKRRETDAQTLSVLFSFLLACLPWACAVRILPLFMPAWSLPFLFLVCCYVGFGPWGFGMMTMMTGWTGGIRPSAKSGVEKVS